MSICSALSSMALALLCLMLFASAVSIRVDRNITIGMSFSLSFPTTLARVDQGKRTRDGTDCCTLQEARSQAVSDKFSFPSGPQISSFSRLGVLLWHENLSNQVVYVGGQTIGVNLVIRDDQANSTLLRQIYTEMAADPAIDFLLGPVNSDFSIMAKTITEPRRTSRRSCGFCCHC